MARVGMIGLAQAAALWLAISLSWHAPMKVPLKPPVSPEIPTIAQEPASSLDSMFEIEQGQVVVIRSHGSKVEVDDLSAHEPPKFHLTSLDVSDWREVIDLTVRQTPNGMDPWDLVYNEFEPFSMSEVEIEEGQVVLIRSNGSQVDVVDLTAQETANVVGRWLLDHNELERTLLLGQLRSWSVDQWMLVYNELEWPDGTSLAMTE
jgi:hypothetical protein